MVCDITSLELQPQNHLFLRVEMTYLRDVFIKLLVYSICAVATQYVKEER